MTDFTVMRFICPPGPNGNFVKDFSDFLSATLKLSRLVIVGDFNIHVDDKDLFSKNIISIIDSFSFIQYVAGLPHSKGQTLELVFTSNLNIDCLYSE